MCLDERVLTACVVGCGRIGSNTSEELRHQLPDGWFPLNHIEAIGKNKNIRLIGLCDINKDNLQTAQRTYKIDKGYLDYKKMIDDLKPDILSIATRTSGRTDIICYA